MNTMGIVMEMKRQVSLTVTLFETAQIRGNNAVEELYNATNDEVKEDENGVKQSNDLEYISPYLPHRYMARMLKVVKLVVSI